MRTLNITDTAVDLGAQNVPFLVNYTLVAINATAGSITLQQSDVVGSGYATLATVAAGKSAEVTPTKQYLKLSTATTLILVGN